MRGSGALTASALEEVLIDTRFTQEAAEALRTAIREAGGVEVLAVGRLYDGRITEIEVHGRGHSTAVAVHLRANDQVRAGDVIIHNHPSGDVRPSEPDLEIAFSLGREGIGFVVVDNRVERAQWVVEPHVKRIVRVADDEVTAFFRERLPKVIEGHEARPGQVRMAVEVNRALNADGSGHVAVIEAGTGTGKSLAYLVPAALWAKANGGQVVVSTFTRALQDQLAHSDLPLLRDAGIEVDYALLKGRTNYLCRRRLAEAVARERDERGPFHALDRWAEHHETGGLDDLNLAIDPETWDRVASDHDQTLAERCPHYDRCFYYRARRDAGAAQIVVVNHALLLTDLAIKKATTRGILPNFDRLVIDEAHHLEAAATGIGTRRLTALGVRHAIARLLPRKREAGALERIIAYHASESGPLDKQIARKVRQQALAAQAELEALKVEVGGWMEALVAEAPEPLRLTPSALAKPSWSLRMKPTIATLACRLARAAGTLDELALPLSELPDEFVARDPQPIFDLNRARRRLLEDAALCSAVLRLDEAPAENAHVWESSAETVPFPASEAPSSNVWWLEPNRSEQGTRTAVLCTAPIEVGPTLRATLFSAFKAVVLTSASLTVGGGFGHYRQRVGLDEHRNVLTARFLSPFDYARQALLAIPRDVPPPDHPRYEQVIADFIAKAVEVTGGGAFVLCTSYRLLDTLHDRVRELVGPGHLLLKQTPTNRRQHLDRFRKHGNAVLFGTDSFWEGVDVPGRALRLILIPRLPFRAPTDPIQQARHDALKARGLDPFRAYSLPEAVLRLRQGFGRLIRTRRDRGAVVILDRRVIDRQYGRVFLASLPEVPRVTGPAHQVLGRLRSFHEGR